MQGPSSWALTEQEVAVGGICEHPCRSGTRPGLHHPGREGASPNLQIKATDSERSCQLPAITQHLVGRSRPCLLRCAQPLILISGVDSQAQGLGKESWKQPATLSMLADGEWDQASQVIGDRGQGAGQWK